MSKYERKLSNGTKHTKKKLKVQEGRDIWFIHNKNRSTFGIIAHSIHLMKISCLLFSFYTQKTLIFTSTKFKTFRQNYVRLNLVNYLVFCVIHHAIGVYQTICFLSLIIRTHINFIVKQKKISNVYTAKSAFTPYTWVYKRTSPWHDRSRDKESYAWSWLLTNIHWLSSVRYFFKSIETNFGKKSSCIQFPNLEVGPYGLKNRYLKE